MAVHYCLNATNPVRFESHGPEAAAQTRSTIRFRSYDQIQIARDIPGLPILRSAGFDGDISIIRYDNVCPNLDAADALSLAANELRRCGVG